MKRVRLDPFFAAGVKECRADSTLLKEGARIFPNFKPNELRRALDKAKRRKSPSKK